MDVQQAMEGSLSYTSTHIFSVICQAQERRQAVQHTLFFPDPYLSSRFFFRLAWVVHINWAAGTDTPALGSPSMQTCHTSSVLLPSLCRGKLAAWEPSEWKSSRVTLVACWENTAKLMPGTAPSATDGPKRLGTPAIKSGCF